MCGISGAIDFKSRTGEIASELVHRLVKSQRSRGPDFERVHDFDLHTSKLSLGHNRLSIIDLHAEANQPMFDHSQKYCLVYNGEIYNYIELKAELEALGHRFMTQSDTEVVLEAFKEWGPECLSQLNGMFAFALFDRDEEKLWLCRDRYGVKPCFYYYDQRFFAFASTTNELASYFGLKPNMEYVARGLKYSVFEDSSDMTPYGNLQAIKSGHYLCLGLNKNKKPNTSQVKYYNLIDNVEALVEHNHQLSEADLLEQVESIFSDAVRVRLRSDVPVGVSLSGGLDSASVAARLTEDHPLVTGICFGDPDDPKTEAPIVHRFCKVRAVKPVYVNTKNTGIEHITEVFRRTVQDQDAPFPGGSIISQNLVFQRARELGLKVMLGGQGGDEIFMGYRKYQVFRFRELVQKRNLPGMVRFLYDILPLAYAEAASVRMYWQQRARYTSRKGMDSLLTFPDIEPLALGHDENTPLWHRQVRDVLDLSLPTLLRYEDRNSMGNSVETRLPFMDFRLVELALSLPTSLKLRKGYGKWVMRQVVRDRVPDEIRLARFKRGFDVQIDSWLTHGLGNEIRKVIGDNSSKLEDFFNKRVNPAQAFCDQELLQAPNRMFEAVTLYWLAQRI